MQLTEEQGRLLAKINQYSEANRRTDRLATCMTGNYGGKWDTSHTAFIAVQLRALGCVTSTKDAGAYALWNITTVGKAALLEHNNVKVCPGISKNEAPVTVPQQEVYAVVPAAGAGGFIRFSNYDEALAKAKQFTATLGKDHEVVAIRPVAVVHYSKPVPATVTVEVKP